MKVLEVNTVCGSGSTGRITVDLYNELKKDGSECIIAYGRGNAPRNIRTIRIGNSFDNYIHGLKTRILDKHGFSSTIATKRFLNAVEEYDPDIIHLHNLHGYYINLKVLFDYLRKSEKKVIWTLHDCWSFTGHCSHFEYAGCDRWKKGCFKCPQSNEYPSSKFVDNSKWNYEEKKRLFTSLNKDKMKIVTPSKALAQFVKESFLSKYRIQVINNGIDTDIFKPTECNFREKNSLEDKIIILGVANVWTQRKGIEFFCEWSRRLNEKYKIILVGVDKDILKKIPKNILALERTNDTKELAQLYTTADVYVNPTLEEVFGMTNLESLACGTPVIIFDIGACRENINDKCGVVMENGSVSELLDSINKVRRLESRYCIENAKERTKNIMVNRYLKLYYDESQKV